MFTLKLFFVCITLFVFLKNVLCMFTSQMTFIHLAISSKCVKKFFSTISINRSSK